MTHKELYDKYLQYMAKMKILGKTARIAQAGSKYILLDANSVEGKVPDFISSIDSRGEYKYAHIDIPNSVVEICDECFASSALIECTIPESVVILGDYLFDECDSLTRVVINANVEAIPKNFCFSCGELEEVVLPSGLNVIGEEAFCDCGSLRNMSFTSSLRTLMRKCLSNTALHSVDLSHIEIIEPYVFSGCSSLQEVKGLENVKRVRVGAFAFTGVRNVSLSARVVDEDVFRNCDDLEEVLLCEGVEKVLFRAFGNCTKLRKVTLPRSIQSVQENAFIGCNLEEVFIPKEAPRLINNAFRGVDVVTYY